MASPVVKLTLCAFSVLGVVQLWGRTLVDGTLNNLLSALHGPHPYLLPGTHAQLRSSFTGVFPVDYLLRILVVFFWEVADGSHPTSSAIGLYFLGQYFSVLLVFYLDHARHSNGNKPDFVRPTLWLILFQATGIGCAGPLWAILHLRVSADNTSVGWSSLKDAQLASMISPHVPCFILAALVVGYASTASLMLLPSPHVLPHSSKQIALFLWNVFPVWVLVVMIGLQAVFPLAQGAKSNVGSRKESDAAPQETHRRHIANVSLVYAPALIVCLHSHIAVLTVSISTCLFPALFRSEYLAYLKPSEVFVPPLAITIGQSTGDGTRSFMLWDQFFGYGTVMMVMLLRLQAAASAAGRPLSWVKLVAATVLASLVVGPGSTCLLISWLRDILLFVQ